MAKVPKNKSKHISTDSNRTELGPREGADASRKTPMPNDRSTHSPPQQRLPNDDVSTQRSLVEIQWECHPFALEAFMPTEAPDVELLTNDECETVFQDRVHDGMTVYVHARYDWCPALRAYCRVGIGPDGRPYWLVERTDGAKFAVKYPRTKIQECFDHFLAVLQSFKAAVNSSPHSPSYCQLAPQDFTVADRMKKFFPDFTSDLCDLGFDLDE